MQHKVRDLVRDWRADDAKKLAIMEVESEAAWPGGGGWQTWPGIARALPRLTSTPGRAI